MEAAPMEADSAEDGLTPRNYQVQLMDIALKKNTIIFLPTGSGKTYIAILVLKRMSESLLKSYSDGGKISIILVNTVALVDQHAKCLEARTNFSVGRYTGDMNLDFWPRTKWLQELNKYQVFVMTVQILVNTVHENYLDLNKVNLLIFDECHRGVSDQPMRQLCKSFENLFDPPRVLGLTATLLNGNCAPNKVMESVRNLEVTYHAQVATVDGLEHVVGFSTNPKERITYFTPHNSTVTEMEAIRLLEQMNQVVMKVKTDATPAISLMIGDLKPLAKSEGLKKLANNIVDLIEQIRTLGTYGGSKAVLAHMIQIERLKNHCVDIGLSKVLCFVQTQLICVRQKLENCMKGCNETEKFFKFSSEKVLRLVHIFEEYQQQSEEELCGIIFTQRRFTAKILNHILRTLSESVPKYNFIKPNFMVGNSNNPYNSTRESLYIIKKNREVLQSFENKEINLLIASNVLEEGVDIPMCTLVVKFDKPLDYRSYVQSKGRARHKQSLFYMLVERNEASKFLGRYAEYQEVERILNTFLIGKNEERTEPSEEDVQMMYEEDEIQPYYTRDLAKVSMQSAIPLLNMYCDRLPHDMYTDMSPEYWFEEKYVVKGNQNETYTSITVVLPTVCPILDPVKGPFLRGKKAAKRAAALKVCEMLHKCGELDDHLVPRRRELQEEDISFLFAHYPKVKEPTAGNSKNKRVHKKEIPRCIAGPIKPNVVTFLHTITFHPVFDRKDNINDATIYDIYTNPLSFGVLTPKKLPPLCEFPIYVSLGMMKVNIKVNVKEIVLSETDINDIKEFHVLVFADVLRVLKPFLIFDETGDAETLLLVPVNAKADDVDLRVVREHKEIKNVMEITTEEKMALEVTQESHLRKIVSPWYRDAGRYIVTEVTLSKTPLSDFPNEDFGTFVEYYGLKHNLRIVNTTQPLLLVKGLTKRLNFFKPQGEKRKRDKSYEETVEYMIPELVVKQEFPSSLWIQASFLPTVLTRLTFMLRLEELRSRIVREGRLGSENVPRQPLELDEHLVNYEPRSKQPKEINVLVSNITNKDEAKNNIDPLALQLSCNQDYVQKMLEAEYPWKNKDEPKDIERHLDVTVMDIDYYENFIYHPVTEVERMKDENIKNAVANHNQLALTYHKDFTPKSIKLLENKAGHGGPDLKDLYAAFASAHANDIVNLERLETLGDSFLKLITSIYISLRFPRYDEGQSTALKGRLVSNKNLFYLAAKKNFGGIMRYNDLMLHEWMPPCFKVPDLITKRIEDKEIAYSSLFHMNIPFEEQVSGVLSADTKEHILNEEKDQDETEEDLLGSVAPFFKSNYIGDKHVADTVEAAIGCYLESCGIEGALKFVEWMGVIPPSENLKNLLNAPPVNPVIGRITSQRDIDYHIPGWQKLEESLGYRFKNRAYLLQALTHSSYTPNRITYSYEKLEFLGDAILDFLITCHIYETSGRLSPGELTDLRSALVNNNTFASLAVRCNFHKSVLIINATLQSHIDRFVKYIESKNYEINDEVLILLEEDDVELAEYVDVPKVLGDLFEAIAGAVYLDSGKDLSVVWRVFYKLMWKEIDLFSANVPKNVVRRLYEWMPSPYPEFGASKDAGPGATMVPLNFMLDGHLKRVFGFGSNKTMAKKAAAKLALRLLEK